jgi:TRAP-type C4-dicarboxylate transport system permease small subunit
MRRIVDAIVKQLERIVTIFFFVIVSTASAEIFARYLFQISFIWVNDLNIQLTIWGVWLCAPIGLARKQHMKVDFFEGSFSPAAQRILDVVFDFLTIAFLVIVGIWGIAVIKSVAGMTHLTLLVPTGLLFAAAPVGACLMVFVIIPDVMDDVRDLLSGNSQDRPPCVKQGGH